MKISKKRTDLDRGMLIKTKEGVVKLTSDYDVWHDCYDAVECDKAGGDEYIPSDREMTISPLQLIDCEIIE